MDVTNLFISTNRFSPTIAMIPFEQSHKRMVVVRQMADKPDSVRVYVKGAPEYVITSCTTTLDSEME